MLRMLESLLTADAALRAWIVTHHTPWLDQAMWTLSALGSGGTIWLAIAAVMGAGFLIAAAVRRRRAAA